MMIRLFISMALSLAFAGISFGQTVTVWEATSGVSSHPFAMNSTQMTSQSQLPFNGSSRDFTTNAGELYDVMRSDQNGRLNIDGQCVQYGDNTERRADSISLGLI